MSAALKAEITRLAAEIAELKARIVEIERTLFNDLWEKQKALTLHHINKESKK